MLEHGGRIRGAARRYGIPLHDWLDLSTGINPHGWPVPDMPPEVWSRLPEEEDDLEGIAAAYYGTESLLAVAGSQAAIQTLPQLRAPNRIGVLSPGYAEHMRAWRRAGHTVILLAEHELEDAVPALDVLVLIQPNNPTGACYSTEQLLAWHTRLATRGGWLVVDEAFIDMTPDQSLAPYCPLPGLIVLRSVGKFFGLAGIRVGFVLAEQFVLQTLSDRLGPWTIANPSRWIAARALADQNWQKAMRVRLLKISARLVSVLNDNDLHPAGGCSLFSWVCTPSASAIHKSLARQGVLTRLFADPPSLRFGLPGNAQAWSRLESGLAIRGS